MRDRDPQRESPRPELEVRGATPPSALANEESAFRRGYRWLNLTLVQTRDLAAGGRGLGRAGGAGSGDAAALVLAAVGGAGAGGGVGAGVPGAAAGRVAERRGATRRGGQGTSGSALREQFVILVVGVTTAVALLRLFVGPLMPVLKLEAFGVAQVAAYQAINFGVVGRSSVPGWGQALPALLFGVSWGLQEVFGAAASPGAESLVLAFAGGGVLGLAFGGLSYGLRRWPGGYLTASALQFLLVYLVLGFLRV